jgi:hypothetical protein
MSPPLNSVKCQIANTGSRFCGNDGGREGKTQNEIFIASQKKISHNFIEKK